jgi:SpoVK/Ycf46/Vps4 family AAA+-type ATPase
LKATWDDIVLPKQEMFLLLQIAGQVNQRSKVYADWGFERKMNRGLGITALFAGDSGTGKTLAAEVLANELRLNLYRIDLSAVVSKYTRTEVFPRLNTFQVEPSRIFDTSKGTII